MLGTVLAAARIAAQDEPDLRLTVRPRAMATGTRNEATGTFPLSVGGELYVPPKCVGARRCPLMVTFIETSLDSMVQSWQLGADAFGILLLVSNMDNIQNRQDVDVVDAAIKEALARFAVEPDKIATKDVPLAVANPEVFSRSIPVEGPPGPAPTHRRDPGQRLEIYQDAGVTHDYHFALTAMVELADWRAQGYPTKQWLGLRAHAFDTDYHNFGPQATFYFVARWLDESWRIPDPAQRPPPAAVADPLPHLTVKAITQMIAFWASFQQEPDSIRAVVRPRYLREVLVPVGPKDGLPSTGMVDMAALAAAVPSVAAKLKAAGLTPEQHDAYRLALLSAIFAAAAQDPTKSGPRLPAMAVDPTSVLGQNVAFILAHSDELVTLEQTAIWMTP